MKYRLLNAFIMPDIYPLLRMDEYNERSGETKVFTALDALCGYLKVPIKDGDKNKITITSHLCAYRCTLMTFGLQNSPAMC